MGAGNVKPLKTHPSAKVYELPPQPISNQRNKSTQLSTTNKTTITTTSTSTATVTTLTKVWKIDANEHRSLICRFCGGKSCKREDWTKQTNETPALKGMHSTWISGSIMGMQRPSSRLIKKYDLVNQFKTNNIFCIINLQLRGEHALCGDGIRTDSGFSYDSTEFTDHGIYYYNYGWVDMSIPSLERMIQIVHVIQFHISERGQKVAVHCHAGYGRTGIVIACYYIYCWGMQPEQAIQSVRNRRPGSVQTNRQVKFVHMFYEYCTYLRTVFANPTISKFNHNQVQTQAQLYAQHVQRSFAANFNPTYSHSHNNTTTTNTNISTSIPYRGASTSTTLALSQASQYEQFDLQFHANKFTLQDNLIRQRAILQGSEREEFKHLPKLISLVCSRLYLTASASPYFLAACFVDGFRVAVDMEEQKEMERQAQKLRLKQYPDHIGKPLSALLPLLSDSTKHTNNTNNTNNTLIHTRTYHHHTSSAHNTEELPVDRTSSINNNVPVSAVDAGFSSTHIFADGKDSCGYDNSTSKWSLQHDDQLITIKKRINIGDWSLLPSCDPRYLTALLFDYLDDLLLPILPVLTSTNTIRNNNTNILNPNTVLVPSPQSAFHAIPTHNLSTVQCIIHLLTLFHEVDTMLLSRVYVRFAFSLLHPTLQLPESCTVKTWFGNSNYASEHLNSPINNSHARTVTAFSPAAKSLVDNLIQFMHGFVAVFPTLYSKYIEERNQTSRKIGVRNNNHLLHIGSSVNELKSEESQTRLAGFQSKLHSPYDSHASHQLYFTDHHIDHNLISQEPNAADLAGNLASREGSLFVSNTARTRNCNAELAENEETPALSARLTRQHASQLNGLHKINTDLASLVKQSVNLMELNTMDFTNLNNSPIEPNSPSEEHPFMISQQ